MKALMGFWKKNGFTAGGDSTYWAILTDNK